MNIDLWPLLLYSSIVVVLIIGLLFVSTLLGQKRSDHATQDVYESGVFPTGSSQIKINVPFYRTAILFIIFDLEAAFLLVYAISIREVGWLGYVEVCIFIGILVAGLLYLWRSGALEWRTARQQNDLKSLKGPGGVVNIRRGPEPKARAAHGGHHDGHSAAHSGADH